MESKYFKSSPETSRQNAILEGRKTVLSKEELISYDSDINKELLSTVNEDYNWTADGSILEDPKEYNKVNKKIVADVSGLLSGGELLSNLAESLNISQDMEIAALEKYVSILESDLNLVKHTLKQTKASGELWTISYSEDKDYYISNEENSIGDSNPEDLELDPYSGNLILKPISITNLYSASIPARIRLISHLGGEVISPKIDRYSEFEFFPIKIHNKSNSINRNSIPWASTDSSGVSARVRIDLSVPGIFSKFSICSGIKQSSIPSKLYWYPFGNEGYDNILYDPTFSVSLAGGASGWTTFGTGASFIPASGSSGTDPRPKLLTYPLQGNSASLLVLNPGLSETTYSGEYYSEKIGAFQTLHTSSLNNGGPMRLAVRWRGLGKYISGKDVFVTVEFYGDFEGTNENDRNRFIYSDRYSLKDGLKTTQVPAAGEFSLSKFLIYCPSKCSFAKVILTCSRPGGFSDPLSTSLVEIAQVSIDTFAGQSSTWTEPAKGQPGGFASYVCSVPFQPEADFFEVVLDQVAYEKEADSNGFYGNTYDLSIRDVLIQGIEYSRSGRWASKIKTFNSEPRRFQLIVPEEVDISNLDFKLSLRPGEQSYSLDPSVPLQILSTEETSYGFQDNTITYSIQDKVEVFENGTDLSGMITLSFYPYVNKERILTITNSLTVNGSRLEYDPNSIDPLVYT